MSRHSRTQKFDGSTWQPGSTVGAAPKISVPQERKARKAMAKELRALKAPVSAHTPFAKSIRCARRARARDWTQHAD